MVRFRIGQQAFCTLAYTYGKVRIVAIETGWALDGPWYFVEFLGEPKLSERLWVSQKDLVPLGKLTEMLYGE